MSGLRHQGVVRILWSGREGAAGRLGAYADGSGAVVGSGLIVRTPQGTCVLTAAHVVDAALERAAYTEASPGDLRVAFDIPAKGVARTYLGRVIEWSAAYDSNERAAHPLSDLALLQLDTAEGNPSLPRDLLLLGPEDFSSLPDDAMPGRLVRCFGFARPDGGFAEGKVRGSSTAGWFHLDATAAGFIEPGFSGAPVFDATWRRVLGVAIALDGNADRRVAYLQSTANVWRVCPALARPYRGLRAFEEEDAAFFFGRDRFVGDLMGKAQTHALLGVTAASGSGKSSLIRAGLLPRLKLEQGAPLVMTMRPLSDPWKELAKGLVGLVQPPVDILEAVDRVDQVARTLRDRGAESLKDYAGAILAQRTAARLVIFVDQFEELFTLAGHEREDQKAGEPRLDFRDLMAATASLKGSVQIQWIYALRGDFADRAFKRRAFTDAVGEGNVLLADMTETELREAVSKPAEALGVAFEPASASSADLITRIVVDAGRTQGALPLMQHVLEQLWRGMRGRVLTHAAYDQLGGVQGALNRHADEVFGQLTKEEQGLAQRLFSRLVNVEDNGEVTRRVQTRGRLGEDLWEVAQKLAGEDSRLLTLRGKANDADPAAGSETAEVAHEALQRHWERLKGWIKDDQRFHIWRRRFEQQMHGLEYLPAGAPLETALAWLATRRDDLDAAQQAYIEASLQRKKEADREKERQQQRILELAAERERQIKRSKRFARVAAVLAILAMGAASIATWYWRDAGAQAIEANEQRQRAEDDTSRYLAVISDGLRERGRLVEAGKIARESIVRPFSAAELERKRPAYEVALNTLSSLEAGPHSLRGHESFIKSVKVSPRLDRILTSSEDGTVRLWDYATGRVLKIIELNGEIAELIYFSPNGLQFLVLKGGGDLAVFDTFDGRENIRIRPSHEARFTTASFNSTSDRIITGSEDGDLQFWNSKTGAHTADLEGMNSTIVTIRSSSNSEYFATLSDQHKVSYWTNEGRAIAEEVDVMTPPIDFYVEGNSCRLINAVGAIFNCNENISAPISSATDATRLPRPLIGAALLRDGQVAQATDFLASSFQISSADGSRRVTVQRTALLKSLKADDSKNYVVSLWNDNVISVVDIDGRVVAEQQFLGGPISTFEVLADATVIALGTADGVSSVAQVWRTRPGHLSEVDLGCFLGVARHYGERLLCHDRTTNAVLLRQASDGGVLARLGTSAIPPQLTSSEYAVIADFSTNVRLLSFHDGSLVDLAVPDGTNPLAMSEDGRRLVMQGTTSFVWNRLLNVRSADLTVGAPRITSAALSPSIGMVAIARRRNVEIISETDPSKRIEVSFRFPPGLMRFSRDGDLLAVMAGRALFVIDTNGGKIAYSTAISAVYVHDVVWAPNSKHIAVSTETDVVVLTRELTVIGRHERSTGPTFSRDGHTITSVGSDGLIKRLQLAPAVKEQIAGSILRWHVTEPFGQSLLNRLAEVLPRRLTREQQLELLRSQLAVPADSIRPGTSN